MTYVQEAGGLASAEDYPYRGVSGNCRNGQISDKIVEGTAPSKVAYGSKCERYYADCDNMDEYDLAAKVEQQGPMVACVNASPWQYYNGGVLSSNICNQAGTGRHILNHAV